MGSGWDLFYGQGEILRELKKSLSRGRAHHAWLFHGPRGTGKSAAARAFAAALLSPQSEPEGEVLRRVLEGIHPDFIMLEPEGNFIRISQVQELQHALGLKPLEAGRMVAIIDDAEAMNEEAANTLLKTLEEPPGDSVIILVSSLPDRLPSTVVSRCCQVRFRPLRPAEVRAFLMERKGLGEEEADRLVAISGGILSQALSFLEDDSRMLRRDEALRMAEALRGSPLHLALDMAQQALKGAEEAARKVRDEGAGIRELGKALDPRTAQRLEKAEKARGEKEARRRRDQALRDYLQGLASWFRDLVVFSQLVEERKDEGAVVLENIDHAEAIHQASHHIYPERAVEAVRACERAAILLSRNANPQLVMENVLLELHAVANHPGRSAESRAISSLGLR